MPSSGRSGYNGCYADTSYVTKQRRLAFKRLHPELSELEIDALLSIPTRRKTTGLGRHASKTSFRKGHISHNKGKAIKPVTINKIRAKTIQRWQVEKAKECSMYGMSGKHHSEEARTKLRKRSPYTPEQLRRILSSRRPTNIEQIVIDVIAKYSLPFRYTGDGSFIIGRKNPDFVNINGEKIAVDIFGDRWHELEEIPLRKAAFAEYGWELVILWGHEVESMTELEIAKRLPK